MTQNKKIKIGIIGGTGLDDPNILKNAKELSINTPYGKPSEKLVTGRINKQDVVILARHGKKHSINPTLVPYRANIWALKSVGVTHIFATNACGSLNEEMKPGDLAFIDQFIDITKHRQLTFFEDKVVHTPMAEPFDINLRKLLIKTARKLKLEYHPEGTIITIEGPRFSTKAESKMFRLWGADLIGMTTAPEVILANEIGIPYQSISIVTDYDCWKESEESVTEEIILKRMKENADKVKRLLLETIKDIK